MALFTTIPAKEIMPIMVIRITNSILKITNPSSTPIKLNSTETEIIIGVLVELNCPTIIKKIKASAISRALDKNAICLACSSCSPVNVILISSGSV